MRHLISALAARLGIRPGMRILYVLRLLALLAALPGYVFAAPFAYITNAGSNTVSVIDTASNTVTATVSVGNGPTGVAVNPAGTRVYVANYVSDSVSVIDTASNTVTATVNVGSFPQSVAVNPAGTRVYVANRDSDTVSVIDTALNTVTATVNVGNWPQGVAVNPAGTRVYVANYYSDTVSVIDTASNTVTATLNVGNAPIAFGAFIGPAPAVGPAAAGAPIPTLSEWAMLLLTGLLAGLGLRWMRGQRLRASG